ncbi:putative mitochondrial carrier protein [Handroanthus impetiginosus]|uniref:Putative mitochondrial carrier protein n=1 Tax=Handroanthus impetiginosus TaxID=429701 RepID=A0A2G9HR72_9LAMI|nr:putative mitochondrial carrier protein [Handroanthus impetiginosus]
MNLSAAEDDSASKIHLPADIDWDMLDKSKFFFLGAALFSSVCGALYPIVVLKTRQQVMLNSIPCFKMAASIFQTEGARALYMGALEVTKRLSEGSASAIANATAGLTASMAAQLVWTPIDVVSQRLMVQGGCSYPSSRAVGLNKYNGRVDAFRKIISTDGVRGLYRGFGISILTYAPSNAVWWASYSIAHRSIWSSIGNDNGGSGYKTVLAVQGLSAAMASGASALVTMPLDTIKTRLQVLDGEGSRNVGRKSMILETMRKLFLKRLSTKNQEGFGL